MRKALIAAAILAVATAAASAQQAPPPPHHHRAKPHAHTSAEKPVDVGPNTPDANAAYQGGGVVLQGAPGAPAPKPQATPPGQAPAGSVPP